MAESLLQEAWNLYRRGRFSEALSSLEARVFQFREDPEFFRVMGLCCLRMGDWKGGETYLERSRQLDDAVHRDTLVGLMAVAARKRDYAEALKKGVELLDRNPDDKTAKKALAQLRTSLAAPEGAPGPDAEALASWLPGYRKSRSGATKWLLRGLVAVLLLVGLVLGGWWGFILVAPVPEREGPSVPSLGWNETVVTTGDYTLNLTPEEVKLAWASAQRAFQNYQDSRARFEINRLLLSNASASVKERARALVAFLHKPDFSRPDDSSAYQDVKRQPLLYEGCTVRWRGVIANLVSGDHTITFDLLLGYQEGQVVEGVVPVELGFAALLKNSQVVEVLGRVALREGAWYVEGVSLRDIGYRAP